MFHEKHLQRAVEIQHWIAYHQNNIAAAQRMPLTATAWEVSEGVFQFAHLELLMTEAKLHDILVAGVIADAERQIAELRDELKRLGVAMGDAVEPVPAPRFAIVREATHATAGEALEAGLPVVFATDRRPAKSKPARGRTVVTDMRKVINGKHR